MRRVLEHSLCCALEPVFARLTLFYEEVLFLFESILSQFAGPNLILKRRRQRRKRVAHGRAKVVNSITRVGSLRQKQLSVTYGTRYECAILGRFLGVVNAHLAY